jgi:hypothetical protein
MLRLADIPASVSIAMFATVFTTPLFVMQFVPTLG